MSSEQVTTGKRQGGDEGELSSRAEARLMAMSNKTHRRVLRHIVEHGPIAAVEVRHALRLKMSEATYSCRVLRDLGCVEIVKTEPVRGSVKSYLVATERHIVEDDEWEQLAPGEKGDILASVFQPVVDDFMLGIEGGTIGQAAADFHMTRVPLRSMDAEGFAELRAAHDRLFRETTEIARRAAERMAETGEDGIAVSSSQSCFRVEHF